MLKNENTINWFSQISPGDPVILKYHFVSGMKSEPEAILVPLKIMDDPVPFIKIINPPKSIQLYIP